MKSLAISCFILGTALWLNHTAIRAQEPTHHHRSHAQRVAMDSATSDTGTLASAVKHHRRTPRHTPQHARAISPPPPPPPPADTSASEDQGSTAGFLSFFFMVWVIPAILPALIAKIKKRSFGHHFLRALWRSWILETISVLRLKNAGKSSTITPYAAAMAEVGYAQSLYDNIDLTEAEQKKYSEFIANIPPKFAGIPEATQNEVIAQNIIESFSLTDLITASELTQSEQKKLISLGLLSSGTNANKESLDRLIDFACILSVKKQNATSATIQPPNDIESGSRSPESNQKASPSKDEPAHQAGKEARFWDMKGGSRYGPTPVLIAKGNTLYKASGTAPLLPPIAEIKDGRIRTMYRQDTAGIIVASTDGTTVGKGMTKLRWLRIQGNKVIQEWYEPAGGSALPFIEGENCTKEQLAMAAAIWRLGYGG